MDTKSTLNNALKTVSNNGKDWTNLFLFSVAEELQAAREMAAEADEFLAKEEVVRVNLT